MKYTITTKLNYKQNKEIIEYFENHIGRYSYICRICWHIINNSKNDYKTVSKLCNYLQNRFSILKRTANAIVKYNQGLYNSMKGIKKLELHQKSYKIFNLEKNINIRTKLLTNYKIKLSKNIAINLLKYKNLKKEIVHKKFKLNKLKIDCKNLRLEIEKGIFKCCFGTKRILQKDKNKFKEKRNNKMYFVGGKYETSGNQLLQLTNTSNNNFKIKFRKDFEYKNEKLNKNKYIYGKCKFYNHLSNIKSILNNKNEPLSYILIKRKNKYYLQCSFNIEYHEYTSNKNGIVGVDFNKGFVAVSEINKYGDMTDNINIEYRFGKSNKTSNDLLQIISFLLKYALFKKKNIAIENLTFVRNKSKLGINKYVKHKSFGNMLSSLPYNFYVERFKQMAYRYGVKLELINPAWSSKIAHEKYCNRMKLNIHTGASFIIARRGIGLMDGFIEK